MSAYTKRKHVSKEVEEFDDLPNDRAIVKIVCGKGNNLHLVQTDNGEEYLVSMPTKFRKYVWVKRGELDEFAGSLGLVNSVCTRFCLFD